MKTETMNIVIVGHVDHGKSTVIGRMLADTNSLPEGKLQQVKENCKRNSKPFEYAFLLDALKDEQSQGITIDSARVFFKTKKRHYIIIDAPGHIEFLKNMVTGAARAEAALLVIDAKEGVRENSYRHGYLLSMLGIKQVAILVNKMDLVDYRKGVYDAIVKKYSKFLKDIHLKANCFIPVSGREGDMVSDRMEHLNWYDGPTVLSVLDQFKKQPDVSDKPFRMPVQGVYKFTKFDDERRIIAGTIETGKIAVGDEVIFYPSGKSSYMKSIENFNAKPVKKEKAGMATGFTLEEQIYVRRGEVAVKKGQKQPEVSSRVQVSIFWLGKEPLQTNKTYFFKIGTFKVEFEVEEVCKVIDASSLNFEKNRKKVKRHEVAECILKLSRDLPFDVTEDIPATNRFVIVDEYNIAGGGIVKKVFQNEHTQLRDQVMQRNYKWIKSNISQDERVKRHGQKSALILITGKKNASRKEIARALEEQLFNDGHLVYFLGIGSVIHGVDADLTNDPDTHPEHFRRLAEVANILLDSGVILFVTSVEMTQADLDIINTAVDIDRIKTIWVGDQCSTDIDFNLKISQKDSVKTAVRKIQKRLAEKSFIPE